MAMLFLLRGLPLRVRPQHHRLAVGLFAQLRRPVCTTAPESNRPEEGASRSAVGELRKVFKIQEPPRLPELDEEDPDFGELGEVCEVQGPSRPREVDDSGYRAWKDAEEEILEDIEPVKLLAKEILHSKRYRDGDRLTVEDSKIVVERLLAYHPHVEDKVGPGLDAIEVNQHPQFRISRCLFVVRVDGSWVDFSYQKCLRGYIRSKYPSRAEKFIRKHLTRGGSYRSDPATQVSG